MALRLLLLVIALFAMGCNVQRPPEALIEPTWSHLRAAGDEPQADQLSLALPVDRTNYQD